MSEAAAVYIHLLHGDDSFSLNRYIKELLAGAGDATEVDMNTTRLDGKTTSFEEIQNAANTLPFFGGARWVIVDSALASLAKVDKSRSEKFVHLLGNLLPGNHLVLSVEDHQRWRKDGAGNWIQVWETLHDSHWLMQWAVNQKQLEIKSFPLPDEKAMDAWISGEVKRQGGAIEPEGARELSRLLGNETSIANQEINKLLTYVDFKRAISAKDVIALVSDEGSADVFVMLDALVEGRTREAQNLMHRLLEVDEPEVILGAVSHRFRQLIQVREALDAREDLKALVERKVIFNNQVGKYTTHARRFNMAQLEAIYHHLLEMDLQAKTSFTDMESDLETLVVEIAEKAIQ
jgi:DNA polymerase III subunit delta